MPVETLGEACSRRDGAHRALRGTAAPKGRVRRIESRMQLPAKELDMETLVWTRGRAFPLSRLESRLRCPRCEYRYVVVLYQPPRRAAVR